MRPRLARQSDVDALWDNLDFIDCFATDHAPHSSIEKDVEFDKAAFGIIGLETSLALSLALVRDGVISIETLVEKMSKNPARIIGVENGIKKELPADLTIIDTEIEHTVNADTFYSLSRNTPFDGMEVKGKATATVVNGNIVYSAD